MYLVFGLVLFFGFFPYNLFHNSLLFPLEQFCFSFRFLWKQIFLGVCFCLNLQLPLVLSFETSSFFDLFSFIHFLLLLLCFSGFQGMFSLTVPWISPCALSLRMVSQDLNLSWVHDAICECCLERNLSGFTCTLVSPLVTIRYHKVFLFSIWNVV